ncbi:BTAD domain-containing putative transcriptional regulator [Nocardioides sp. L-11A]|uniref:BTAD domain-containing putative transcriptional regulator n=1 Tax=Nocardioides sp. L-11A TaxID=3043848 RepID=UPI00249A6535|nr:BTAD domain-containing putative transcriptional regulator [Nocardioides sp. L-11A]
MPDRGDVVPLRLLGPLEVFDQHGAPVDIGSPRHRETLAALAVDAGRVVSTDTLLDRVWGESARGGTLANLQAVISRLRSRLREAGVPADIATAPPGYRLDLPPGAVDTDRLAAGIAAARTALAADPRAAQDHLTTALAWWRGDPLADIPQPFARTEALRLDGLRLTGEELAAELDVALGNAGAAVARLTGLARQHPLRESVRGQLMRALYLAGRQADALAEYADLRARLVDELGVDPGPAVQRLHVQILEQDPALRPAGPASAAATPAPAASPARASLPSAVPPTDLLGPLLGRERDVAHLVDVLRSPTSRLVTVTGVGGCGKTRLALAVAAAAESSFADGVTLVPLAPLHDPSAVIPAIAHAVGVAEGGDPFTALLDLLRGDSGRLLLLDNAEHLLDAWPEVATLAAACPGLRILVTSRIPLRVRGEVLFPLTPLDLPAATELFATRAAATGVAGPLSADDPVVGQLCQRLAGIPLAIELAAARIRLMSPAEILARLGEVMAAEGARDLPPRQRTMRSAIDWSFALLSPREQAAFPRLAVFSGGFGIDAAAAVLADLVTRADVLALLESLVDQSLLVVAPGPRFRLLEPVAQYAAGRLDPDAERTARDAHLRHFGSLAAHYEPSLRGEGTVDTLARIEEEHANLVAAVEWSLASGQADLGGWLGWHLWLYWWIRGALREGRRLMQGVLDAEVDDRVRVRAGAVVGALAFAQGDLDGAEIWEDSAALARRIGDIEGLPYAHGGIGLVALARDDLDLAAAVIGETIELCEDAGLGGEWLWTLSHVWLGTVELLRGDADGAGALVDQALAAARHRNDPLAVYIALFTAIQVSMAQDAPDRARRQIAEGVRLSRDTGDHANLAYLLDALGVVESLGGDLARVGVLRGAADELRAGAGGNVYGYYRPDEDLIARAGQVARDARGAAYDADVAAGRALSVDEMAALATQ